MKKVKISIIVVITLFIITNSNYLNAQWQQDSKYGFKINMPTDWSKSSSMDGTDKVYDYYSADQNAAIQIRVFEAGGGVTTDMLAQIYEENMLDAGTQKIGLKDHSLNGIPCKQGVYLMDYNGIEVGLSAYYISQNNKCYILTAIIPSSMIQQKGEELKQILKSFMIDGFENSTNIVKEENKPSGLSGLLGGTTQNNTNSANTSIGENYVTISGNTYNGTYKFHKSGSYPIKWNKNVVIRGLDNSGINALELHLHNNKNTGTFTYGTATSGQPKFQIAAINGKSVGSNMSSGSGELTITEYREGGMIKGYFHARVNGHDIKGSFSLPLTTPKDFGGYDLK